MGVLDANVGETWRGGNTFKKISEDLQKPKLCHFDVFTTFFMLEEAMIHSLHTEFKSPRFWLFCPLALQDFGNFLL